MASRYIDKAEASLPMHKKGLRRLGEEIDTLVQEVRAEQTHAFVTTDPYWNMVMSGTGCAVISNFTHTHIH